MTVVLVPSGRALAVDQAMEPNAVLAAEGFVGAEMTTPEDGRLRGYGFAATVTSAGTAEAATRLLSTRTDPAIAAHFAEVTFLSDNRHDLPHVSVPTLVIQASEDAIAGPAVGRYVHEHIEGSDFAMLEATGHCPHLSAPDQTIAAMRNFLDRS